MTRLTSWASGKFRGPYDVMDHLYGSWNLVTIRETLGWNTALLAPEDLVPTRNWTKLTRAVYREVSNNTPDWVSCLWKRPKAVKPG